MPVRSLRALAALLLVPALGAGLPPAPAEAAPPARAGQVIPGRFIVALRGGVDAATTAREYAAGGADVDHVYRAAGGFAARMSDGAVRAARADARVARVEPDRVVTLASLPQANAPWGLDRLDQRDLPLDTAYTAAGDGAGVVAYVLDTGIRATHRDLAGRVAPGYTAIADGRGTDDCNGHGTHVAGTVGGAVHGVAKAVTLVPVRVLDCTGSGTASGVLAGIDYVTRDRTSGRRAPAVANLSLGAGASSTIDAAVERSLAAGVAYAVAAGNDGKDACTVSPARVPGALTVGASDRRDARGSFSNVGRCLDLFAPGVAITSTAAAGDTAVATMSGTSMAAPHVAGVVALHLQATPGATPAEVTAAVLGAASPGRVGDAGSGSPTLLLHRAPAPALAPPVASFTTRCSGADCVHTSTATGAVATSTWRLGTGGGATGATAAERFTGTGTFPVALTVGNAAGSTTAQGTVTCAWTGKGKHKALACQ